jgi:hypothetical protein
VREGQELLVAHLLHHDHRHETAVHAETDGKDRLPCTDRPDVLQVDQIEGSRGEADCDGTGEGHGSAIPQQVLTGSQEREAQERMRLLEG